MADLVQRSDFIELPATYVLTVAGANYCLKHSVPMRDLRVRATIGESPRDSDRETTRDFSKAAGFEWRRCRAYALKRLIVESYLSFVEMTRPGFVSVRGSLTRFTGTLVSGLILARFKPEFKRGLSLRPEVKEIFQRRGTAELFANPAALSAAIATRGPAISSVRSALVSACLSMIGARGRGEEGEEEAVLAELMEAIDDETILLVAIAGPKILEAAAESLAAFVRKMEIAEPLSLMLMEFIQLAEKSYLLNLAERDYYARNHPGEIEALLAEESFRDKLLAAASLRGESMALLATFSDVREDRSPAKALDISLRTRGLIGYASRAELAKRRFKTIKEMDLRTLLRIAGRGDQCTELGLAYYDNLEKACAAESIRFSSRVLLDELKDETTVTMRVTL